MMHAVTADPAPALTLSDRVGVLAAAGCTFARSRVRLRHGQDHEIVVVGDAVVYRFPRHEVARRSLPREILALDRLAALSPQVGIVLPEVVHRGQETEPLGRAFVGQRYLPGEPLRPESVAALGALSFRYAADLARVLAALWRVEVTPDVASVLAAAPVSASWEEFAAGVRERLVPLMSEAGRARAEAELDAALGVPAPAERRLVHGDFGGANLRWDADESQLTGVLDWGQAHLGDPAYDLASVAATLGWGFAGVVDDVVEPHDETRLERARAYAGTFALQEAYAGAITGDNDVLAAGLATYR